MFAKSLTTRITVYNYYKYALGDVAMITRTFLDGVYWHDQSTTVFSRTGANIQNESELTIPYNEKITGAKYLSAVEYEKLTIDDLPGHWTVDTRYLGQSRIVKGECPFIFTQGTAAQISQQLSLFSRDYPVPVFSRQMKRVDERIQDAFSNARHIKVGI